MGNLANHLATMFNIDRTKMTKAIDMYNQSQTILNEPAIAYKRKLDENDLAGGLSYDLILDQIESGQSSSVLISNVIKQTGLTMKFLAEEVYEMTPKTFAKYKKEPSTLPKRFLEISIKLIGLYESGAEVFGSKEQFNQWCEKPAIGLDFNIPKNYLSTVTGIEYITEELRRITFGYPV